MTGFRLATSPEILSGLKERLAADRAKLHEQHGGTPPQPEPAADATCPRCNGAGYLAHPYDPMKNPVQEIEPCPSCTAGVIAATRLERSLRESGMEGFEHLRFSEVKPFAKQEHLFDLAFEFLSNPQGWCLMIGPQYTGKTFMARMIANEWLSCGKAVLFRTVPRLLQDLRDGYDKDAEVRYPAILDAVCGAPHLILDDLGQEASTPWGREQLFTITDHRIERRLATIVTTNLSLAEMRANPHFLRLERRFADSQRTVILEFANEPITR